MKRIKTLGERLREQCEGLWEKAMASLSPSTRAALEGWHREQAPVAPAMYHLFVIPDNDEPQRGDFVTFEDLLKAVRELHLGNKRAQFIPFYGPIFRISKPPNVHLQGPDGRFYPIYPPPDDSTLSEDGRVGPTYEAEIPLATPRPMDEAESGEKRPTDSSEDEPNDEDEPDDEEEPDDEREPDDEGESDGEEDLDAEAEPGDGAEQEDEEEAEDEEDLEEEGERGH